MFSIIMPLLDPFDRLVPVSALQHSLKKVFALEGYFELILVNDNDIQSCPQLTNYLRTFTRLKNETVKVVEANENLGTARGFNAGLRVMKPDSQQFGFMSPFNAK